MPFRQIAILVVIGLCILGVGSRLYSLTGERNAAREELHVLQEKAAIVEGNTERINLQGQFLVNPDNLEKELRARLNYRAPGEKTVIIVPAEEATSSEPVTEN